MTKLLVGIICYMSADQPCLMQSFELLILLITFEVEPWYLSLSQALELNFMSMSVVSLCMLCFSSLPHTDPFLVGCCLVFSSFLSWLASLSSPFHSWYIIVMISILPRQFSSSSSPSLSLIPSLLPICCFSYIVLLHPHPLSIDRPHRNAHH